MKDAREAIALSDALVAWLQSQEVDIPLALKALSVVMCFLINELADDEEEAAAAAGALYEDMKMIVRRGAKTAHKGKTP